MKKTISIFLFFTCHLLIYAQASKVWVSDNGNGTYKNPIIDADYSDPDVCRVGDDYYMVASSFNCIPGLPILHSNDLVNWKLIGHALTELLPREVFDKPKHGGGAFAPSIRHHNEEFYIYCGDPDYGIFMVKTTNPSGKWSEPVFVKKGKGLIDPCPLWDDDGKAYLVHALAGSRSGYKNMLIVCEMSTDGSAVLDQGRVVYDGHSEKDITIEGPKFYKRNGYYYIFAPAGGVPIGWQLALRSKSPFGAYERKVVLAQGKTTVNGPHQGGWVDTQSGEDWFIHFQDKYMYGRVVHLQPMIWKNDWPVMGIDEDGDGCGDPVLTYKKPNVGKTYPINSPADSDEFDSRELGLQWQWHANFYPQWYYCATERGVLRLFAAPNIDTKSLWDTPNLLMQKTPGDEFVVSTKIEFFPFSQTENEKAGVVAMGRDYSTLYLQNTKEGMKLIQAVCEKAEKDNLETIVESKDINGSSPIYIKMKCEKGGIISYSYSFDDRKYESIGKSFKIRQGMWIGAKIGLYCNRVLPKNDSGYMDVDYFRLTKK